jgi:ABC-2 type transport system ATP-binding protein
MITIERLTKSYGQDKGVFDLSLQVDEGEVLGYLGPNGAGKTTTIRHLLGFLNPDTGRCFVNGLDCRQEADEIQKFTGYLPGEIAFLDDMNGRQFLNLMAQMRGLKSKARQNQLIEALELDSSGKIRKMSKGMKQKLGIVTALMHDPAVLILDEPTSGLDPLIQQRFVALIQEEKAAGKTILMSSHSFSEIERTCDRVGIIRNGRLVALESVAMLRAAQHKQYVITFADQETAAAFAQTEFSIVAVNDTIVEVAIQDNLSEFLAALPNYSVVALDTVQLGLEDVFMQYYSKDETHV